MSARQTRAGVGPEIVTLAFAAFVAAYAPDMGRGFIKDDFAWIDFSRAGSLADLVALFRRHNGFYRPLVGVSFALDARLFGLWAYGYALTNLLLALLAACAVAALARASGLRAPAAGLAAGLWACNPHGVGGAVMWISGRTSLLLTLFSVLAALLWSRRRPWASVACAGLAAFCKEEALLLPLMLAAGVGLGWGPDRSGGVRAALRTAARFVPITAAYLALRGTSGAYWPSDAPWFYRPTLDPAALLRNVAEYADRALTFPAAVALLAALVVGRRPRPTHDQRRLIRFGLGWLAGGYGLTLFLPVRSSLYVCFPAVGAALAAAAWLDGLDCDARAARRLRWLAALALPALVLLLHSRNARLRRTAELSARTLSAVVEVAPQLRAGATLVLHDAPAAINLRAAFGTLVETAVRQHLKLADAHVWLEPPSPDWRAAGLRPPGSGPRVEYACRAGNVIRVR